MAEPLKRPTKWTENVNSQNYQLLRKVTLCNHATFFKLISETLTCVAIFANKARPLATGRLQCVGGLAKPAKLPTYTSTP